MKNIQFRVLIFSLLVIASVFESAAQQNRLLISDTDTTYFDLQDDRVEFEILKELYDKTNGKKWKNNSNWLKGNSSKDIANWYGVVVENGDVVEIHLDKNNLKGTLPKSVFNLVRIRTLSVSGNELNDSPTSASTQGSLITQQNNSTQSNSIYPLPVISGGNLPVWGLAVKGSIQEVDWRNYPPSVNTLVTSPSQAIGASGVAIDDCGRLAFYVLHAGVEQANRLHIYAADGTQLTNTTSGDPLLALNSANGNMELQVVRVPGTNDEWYIIYSLWQGICSAGTSQSSLYCAARAVYAKVKYHTDSKSLTILQREVSISTSTFLQGKAVSRTVSGDPTKHYLYLAQKTVNSNTTRVHRFIIDATGIHSETISAVTIPATYWIGNIAASSVELSPTETTLAITNRNVGVAILEDIIIFDLNRFFDVNYSATIISVPNLKVFGTNKTIKELYTTESQYACLRYLKNKLSFVEFSPSGRYLYIVGGGYPDNTGGVTYATYLLQIDLQSGTGTADYTVRIQRQLGEGVTTSCTGSAFSQNDHLIEQIESAYDGRIYFTKRNEPTLFVIPNPDDPMPHSLAPYQVNLATTKVQNISMNHGHHIVSMPENIDGLQYLKESLVENFTLDKMVIGAGESVQLTLTDYNPVNIYQVAWGDGTIQSVSNTISSHAYDDPGDYKITLTVTNTNNNCATLTSKNLQVNNCLEVSGMEIHHSTYICAVKFSLSKIQNCLTSYLWNFGDGNTSLERNPLHAYSNPGTYNVSVTISYNCPCAGELTLTKQITFNPSDELEEKIIQVVTDQKLQVISTAASTFSDAWPLKHPNTSLDNRSSYLNGSQGIWRNNASYVYEKDRKLSASTDISTDGTFTLEQFNWEYAEFNAIPNWINANSMTQYSPYSYELENKDVLDVYSAAIYDYGGQLPAANGVNMRHDEMAFTSFEYLDGSVAGNWIMHTGSLPAYTTYKIRGANKNMAIVEASVEQLDNVVEVDVMAYRFFFFLFHNSKTYTKNEIVCKKPHPENPAWSIVVFRTAPYEGLWTGHMRIKNIVSPAVASVLDNTVAHSGKSSMKLTADKTFKQELLRLEPGKSYWVSCWVSRNTPGLTTPVLGTSLGIDIIAKDKNNQIISTFSFAPSGVMIEGWQQARGSFVCPQSTAFFEIRFKRGNQTTLWFDDLRLHPTDGNMKGYVYDTSDYRLKAILDEENFASYFYYDVEGNLYLTKKETKDGIKTLSENISYQVEK